MRNTIEDREKLAEKLDEDDKNTIQEAISEAEAWLSSNDDRSFSDDDAEKDEMRE